MKRQIKAWLAVSMMFLVLSLSLATPALAQSAQQQINNGLCAGSNLQLTENSGQCNISRNDAIDKINNLVHTAVNLLSAVVGVIAVIMIIVGGLRYVTSGGNDSSVTAAKNTILYAIIGLVVVALAQIIVHFVLSKLTG